MSIIDDINANTNKVISGKTNLTTAIIGKGGTVSQVGDLPTFNELVSGIESIKTGGGGGASGPIFNNVASFPVTNITLKQVNTAGDLKIDWSYMYSTTKEASLAGVQVRVGIGYIPTLPQVSTDFILDLPVNKETEEFSGTTTVNVGEITEDKVVGVWVLTKNTEGELQTVRNSQTSGRILMTPTTTKNYNSGWTNSNFTVTSEPIIMENYSGASVTIGEVAITKASTSIQIPRITSDNTVTSENRFVDIDDKAIKIYSYSSKFNGVADSNYVVCQILDEKYNCQHGYNSDTNNVICVDNNYNKPSNNFNSSGGYCYVYDFEHNVWRQWGSITNRFNDNTYYYFAFETPDDNEFRIYSTRSSATSLPDSDILFHSSSFDNENVLI